MMSQSGKNNQIKADFNLGTDRMTQKRRAT